MSQHDFDIANQTASATRSDLNNALEALATQSSGATEPATTYANMMWYETDTNWLWQRNEADSAWIRFGYLDQSGTLSLLDDTKVVNAAGVQQGILGDQTTGTWETGTSTTQSLVSPANVKSAVEALNPDTGEPMVLLGTGNLDGLNSVSVTGLSLSDYIKLEFYLNNVALPLGSEGIYLSSDNSTTGPISERGGFLSCKADILLDTDILYANRIASADENKGSILSTHNFTTSSTAFYVKDNFYNFIGGTFRLYGVRG